MNKLIIQLLYCIEKNAIRIEPCLIRCYPGRPRWSLIRAFIRSLIRRVPNSKPSAFEGRGFGRTFIRSFIRRFIRALSGLIRTVFPLPPPPSKALLRKHIHAYIHTYPHAYIHAFPPIPSCLLEAYPEQAGGLSRTAPE